MTNNEQIIEKIHELADLLGWKRFGSDVWVRKDMDMKKFSREEVKAWYYSWNPFEEADSLKEVLEFMGRFGKDVMTEFEELCSVRCNSKYHLICNVVMTPGIIADAALQILRKYSTK